MEWLKSEVNDEFIHRKWEIALVIGLIFVFDFATVLFWIMGKLKPQDDLFRLKMRTRSWWLMATIFVLATLLHSVITFVALGLLFLCCIERISSISKNVRETDRKVLIWSFFEHSHSVLFRLHRSI